MKRILMVLATIALAANSFVAAAQQEVLVHIKSATMGFDPTPVEINVGDTVTWVKDDGNGIPHTVTKVSGPQNWAPLQFASQGDRRSITFIQPGDYEYKCDVHAAMPRGAVIVKAAVTTPPPTPPPSPSPSPPPPSPSPSPKPSPTASPSPAPSPTPRAPSPSPRSGEVVTGSVTIDQTNKGGRPVGRMIAIVAGIVLAGSAIGLWLLRKTPA